MFLKKKTKKIKDIDRKALLDEVSRMLSDEELVLLVKALRNNTLKQIALSKLREYV